MQQLGMSSWDQKIDQTEPRGVPTFDQTPDRRKSSNAKLIGKLKKVVREIATSGAERDFLALVMLVSRVFPRFIFRVQGVVLTRSPSRLKLPDLPSRHQVVCRPLQPGEVPPLACLPKHEWKSPEELQSSFAEHVINGHQGFVAEIGGKIVAYDWVAYGRYSIPEVRFEGHLQSDEACTFDVYVDPAYRYTRVYVALVRFVSTYLRERGFRWFIGYGDHTNRDSIRTHQRIGYEIFGRVIMISSPPGFFWVRKLKGEANGWQCSFRRRTLGLTEASKEKLAPIPRRLQKVEALRGGLEVIERLAPEWRELCQEPCCGPDWIAAYLRAFAPRHNLLVVTVRTGDRLSAVLPFVEEKTFFYGLPVTKLRSPTNDHFPRFDLAKSDDIQTEAFAAEVWNFLEALRGWDLIEVRDVPEGGGFELLARVAKKEGYHTGQWISMRTPYIPLSDWMGNTEWWLRQRSANFRQTLCRVLRKTKAQGPLVLHRVEGPDPKALERFYVLERAGWKGRQGSAIACESKTLQFYDEIARAVGRDGNLVLYFLEWQGRTLAAHIGMEHRGRYFMLKTTFDEGYKQLAPGHLIVNAVLEECLKRGIAEYDFTGPWEEWKAKWTSEVRLHAWQYIFNRGLIGRAAHLVKFSLRPLLKEKLLWRREADQEPDPWR